MSNVERIQLLNVLTAKFDETEIETLCFALNVDYQSLAGANKVGKARELVVHLERRGRLPELIDLCRRQRPDVDFEEEPISDSSIGIDVVVQRITRESKERLRVLRKSSASRMLIAGYPKSVIADFEFVFGELCANAIEHGCSRSDDPIEIAVEVTDEYVSLIVLNVSGIQFDLDQIIRQQRDKLASDPLSRRGRGLLATSKVADELFSVVRNTGAKAMLYGDTVKLQTCDLDGLTIIEIVSGLDNPSINRKLDAEMERCKSESLILHVARRESEEVRGEVQVAMEEEARIRHSTEFMTTLIDLYSDSLQRKSRLAVFMSTSSQGALDSNFVPMKFIAFSWQQALDIVGKSNLRSKVYDLCREGILRMQ